MKKIFIVEDDLTIQAQLKTLLSGNGYEVFAVTDFSQTMHCRNHGLEYMLQRFYYLLCR